MTDKTPIYKQIANMCPGDSINVNFPDDFTIEYEKTQLVDGKWVKVIEKSSCTRMNVYYWDEDDHCCKDYYFYNGNNSNLVKPITWFCKGRSVTKESWEKINAYLRTYDC